TEREVKDCSLVQFRVSPDPAIVFADNAMHGGQTDARSFKILRSMKPLEYPKQLVSVFHAESHPIIFNEDRRLPVFVDLSNLDNGRRTRPRVLHRITDQVLKNLADEDRIALDKGEFANLPLNLPTFRLGREQQYHLLYDRTEAGDF